MIEIVSASFENNGNVGIYMDSMRMEIEDDRYRDGVINYQVQYLDLKQLAKISLLYEFPDYERRRQEAERRTQDKREENMIVGAAGGAMIDSLCGDDSVLDGAVIGAAVGAIATSSEKIDLKEQSNHLVVMMFKDGNSITVEVDSYGYALLLRILYKAKTCYSDVKASNYLLTRDLTQEELKIAKESAVSNYKSDQTLLSTAILFLSGVWLAGILLISYFEWSFELVVNNPAINSLPLVGLLVGFMVRRNELAKIELGLKVGMGVPVKAGSSD